MSTLFKARYFQAHNPRWLCGRGLALVLAAAIGLGSAIASAAEKIIEVEGQHRSDAVAITKVTFGNSALQCGLIVSPTSQTGPPVEVQPVMPFQAGDDWLKNTTIYLLNRTDRVIVFAQIALVFPETGDGSFQKPMRTYNVTLGRIPQAAAFSGRTGQPLSQPASMHAISFAPGQTLPVSLGSYIDQITGAIDNMPFSTVTRCIIRRTVAFFDDGMKWDGEYSVPDPDNPGKWKRLDARYFPGIPKWPPHE